MIKISDAELEVMNVIWKNKETTSLEIIKELENCNWNDNTIRTLISRLIAKKAVGISKREGKKYTYIPLVEKEEYIKSATEKIIKQFFNGSFLKFMKFLDKDSEVSYEVEKSNKR